MLLTDRIGETTVKGYLRQGVQKPYRTEDPGWELIPIGVLLAIHGLGARYLWNFSKSHRGLRMVVPIDKFTKWPEAAAVVKANKNSALKFIKDLVARFGVPNRIITDNGTQFTSNLFRGLPR